ncbi:MAG: glutamyl-tRNA reductase [Nitrososphaerota archaeon]|nr:glutamyl-tRNA reductase [Nitrososphaerota archaeon]
MDHFDPSERVLNLRVTHKRAPVPVLEAVSFDDPTSAMKQMRRLSTVSECIILQTCNRVEVFALASDSASQSKADIEGLWFRVERRRKAAEDVLETSVGPDAIEHALRVAAGLESMVVGEDEILGQVKKAYEEGRKAQTIGPVLERVFQSALRVGKAVRTATAIDRGVVSVGSAGVELLHESLGDMGRKKVLVIGAGEAGETVAKALAARKSGVIFVANRTYQRASALAKELGGSALPFDALERSLATVDAAVVATSAPHYILSYPMMARVMAARRRKRLVVVDLAEPRNVDLTVARIPGLTLCNLDDLRGVVRSGLEKRSREMRRAERLVEQGLGQALVALKQDRVEPLVASLFREAEAIRRREVEKAVARMSGESGDGAAIQAAVVDALSKVLVKRLLSGPVEFMRRSAAGGDLESLDVAERLFGVQNGPSTRSKRTKPAAVR